METSAHVLPTSPPLQNGDRLTREEFERRYRALPQVKKAELIEGIVYMPSPVRVQQHAEPHALIMTWLGVYGASTPGVKPADNATVRLDLDNEVQPDALLRLEPRAGGQTRISPDDYLEGPPELIVEIAAGSAAYDLHAKRNVYRRSGVQEYLVWQMYEKRLDWFRLSKGQYVALEPDEDALFRSRVFPGLHLHGAALLNGDLAGVLAALHRGLATPEHAAFVETVSRRYGSAGSLDPGR